MQYITKYPNTALNKDVDIKIVEKSKCIGMYSRYDYLLFGYFLILSSLLHSSIYSVVFYTCF